MSARVEIVPTPANYLPLQKTGEWFVLTVRGAKHVPGYDPNAVGRGMSAQTFAREVEGNWSASSGKLVYPEYGDIHEPEVSLPFDPELPLVLGWDLPAATGGTPACVASQVSRVGQWLLYGNLQPLRDEVLSLWEFSERVAEWLYAEFAEPYDLRLEDLNIVHYGDPAGNAPPIAGTSPSRRSEVRSAFEVLRIGDTVNVGQDERGRPINRELPGRGWVVLPGEVSLVKRLEAVRARLMLNLTGGAPALVVDPAAKFIREGFRGGYHFHQRSTGMYELDPMKNRYSHSFDALSYSASRLFLMRDRKARDEDSATYRRQVRAPGRARR